VRSGGRHARFGRSLGSWGKPSVSDTLLQLVSVDGGAYSEVGVKGVLVL
jgi:hypothetical protein